MSPLQSWFLVCMLIAIGLLIADQVKRGRRGRSTASPQLKSSYRPEPLSGRVEIAYNGEQGPGWVAPGGLGVLRPEQLIQILARSGYKPRARRHSSLRDALDRSFNISPSTVSGGAQNVNPY